MKKRLAAAILAAFSMTANSTVLAGPGTSGGLTLLEAPGARASALGEAYSAVMDDVAAFAYNPSALKSLKSGQASFMYQKGLVDDTFSQVMIGSPWRRMGVGLSIGHYDGGDFELSDGNAQRSVSAQKDLVVSLGAARTVGPVSVGLTAKYLSSQLVETERATAYAADIGLSFSVSPRLNLGGAFQNFGTKLKFVSEGDPLPRIMRLGASYSLLPKYGTMLLFDMEHLFNESETHPALGIETRVGPLALRAGYRQSADLGEFSVGTGFSWNRSNVDYSFGLTNGAQSLDSQHRVAYSFRFGGPGGGNQLFVRKKGRENKSAPQTAQLNAVGSKQAAVHPPMSYSAVSSAKRTPPSFAARPPVVAARTSSVTKKKLYVVKPGDNLAQIARNVYGDHRMWRTIYMANRHLISSPTELEVGQRIALPQ